MQLILVFLTKLLEYGKMQNFEFDFQIFCQMSSFVIPQPKNNFEEQVFLYHFIYHSFIIFLIKCFNKLINSSRKPSDC